MSEREIFLEALDYVKLAERSAFLERVCAGDVALRRRIEKLFRSDAAAGPFLTQTAFEQIVVEEDPPAPPGYELGAYVGHGGMGEVYRAVDTRLHREVAIKCLRIRYLADPSVKRRFLAEAKLTAQLQHPGIPPLHEVGTLPDCRPFLAMKLVEGRTLAQLLADETRDRGFLLKVLEGVCQAVGYAHSRGVLHRDLKPANVMVGAFGEVQVMDWGLALHLTDANSAPTTAFMQNANAHDETWTGAIMGTPGYMSPEQARGDSVDRRSDVFGLGALLCAVLTGTPPFEGVSSIETLKANAAGDSTDARLRLAQCGADPELVALCESCLNPSPAERPADAGVVASAIADWRIRVEERAHQAELQTARAEVQSAELARRRRQQLLFGSAILAVSLLGAGVATWQWWRALHEKNNTRIALESVQREQDKTSAALTELRLEKVNTTVALNTMTDDVIERVFTTQKQLTDDQKLFLQKVIALYGQATSKDGDNPESRSLKADGYYRVARIQRILNLYAESEANYRRACTIQAALVAQLPDSGEYRHKFARSRNNLGALLRDSGRVSEAVMEFQESIAFFEELRRRQQDSPESWRELAGVHSNLGGCYRSLERNEDALKEYRTALLLRQEILQQDPANPVARHDLADSHNSLASVLDTLARREQAIMELHDACKLRKALAEEYPAVAEYRVALALLRTNLANLLRDSGNHQLAEEEYREALQLRKSLVVAFPSVPDYQREWAENHHVLADFYRELREFERAEGEYRTAISLRKKLVELTPEVLGYSTDLANSRNNLGVLYRENGQRKEAEVEFLAARELQLVLVNKQPNIPRYRYDLAASHFNLGSLYHETGRHQLAEVEYRAACCLRQALVMEFPATAQYRSDLATSHYNLGSLYGRNGRLEKAVPEFQAAREVWLLLINDQPKSMEYRNSLAGALVNWAITIKDRQPAAARELLLEAEPHQRIALAKAPRNPSYRLFFRNNRSVFVQCSLALNDHASVLKATQELLKHSANPQLDAYTCAGHMTSAMKLLAGDKTLTPERREANSHLYAKQAIAFLKQSVAAGWQDHRQLVHDQRFDLLRNREDFQEFMNDIAAKHPAREQAPPPRLTSPK